MCSPFVLAKRDHVYGYKFSVFYVNVMHFLGQVGHAIVSDIKSRESPFSSSLLRLRGSDSFVGHASTSTAFRTASKRKHVLWSHVAGRFPADEHLIDCELRLLDQELANFVT